MCVGARISQPKDLWRVIWTFPNKVLQTIRFQARIFPGFRLEWFAYFLLGGTKEGDLLAAPYSRSDIPVCQEEYCTVVHLGACCCLARSFMISPIYSVDILLRMHGLLRLWVLLCSFLSIKSACFYSYWDNTWAHAHPGHDFHDYLTVPLVNPTSDDVEIDDRTILELTLRPIDSQSESHRIQMSLTVVTMTFGLDDDKKHFLSRPTSLALFTSGFVGTTYSKRVLATFLMFTPTVTAF